MYMFLPAQVIPPEGLVIHNLQGKQIKSVLEWRNRTYTVCPMKPLGFEGSLTVGISIFFRKSKMPRVTAIDVLEKKKKKKRKSAV